MMAKYSAAATLHLLFLVAMFVVPTTGRRVIVHGVYDRSMINGLSCPIAPVVNHHTLKAVGRLTGENAVDVVIMMDKPLAEYCSPFYHRFLVQTLPLLDINASYIADKQSWRRLRRFDLNAHGFQRADKLLFLDLDAYITGADMEAMFELVSDSDGNRLLTGSDEGTSTMLLSYQPNDFQTLMEAYQQLAAKGMGFKTDSELVTQYAQGRGETHTLPSTMLVLLSQAGANALPPLASTARIVSFGDDVRLHCQSLQRASPTSTMYSSAMGNVIAYICCTGKLVADTVTERGYLVG